MNLSYHHRQIHEALLKSECRYLGHEKFYEGTVVKYKLDDRQFTITYCTTGVRQVLALEFRSAEIASILAIVESVR